MALVAKVPPVRLDGLRDAALAWHIPSAVGVMRGLRVVMDAGPRAPRSVKVAREIMRANPLLSGGDALVLAAVALGAARSRGLHEPFFAAAMLQESAFEPRAMSAAGAVGIAQFTVPTARTVALDPWDPAEALDGAAHLLANYVGAYRRWPGDPYALASAAYNAGPGAVSAYRGVPPYAETRGYIADIRERWSRIVGR